MSSRRKYCIVCEQPLKEKMTPLEVPRITCGNWKCGKIYGRVHTKVRKMILSKMEKKK